MEMPRGSRDCSGCCQFERIQASSLEINKVGIQMTTKYFLLALAASAVLSITTPRVFAASTIDVHEEGEAGGPMSIRLSIQSVAAGPATFLVHNEAATEEHELVLIRLHSPEE